MNHFFCLFQGGSGTSHLHSRFLLLLQRSLRTCCLHSLLQYASSVGTLFHNLLSFSSSAADLQGSTADLQGSTADLLDLVEGSSGFCIAIPSSTTSFLVANLLIGVSEGLLHSMAVLQSACSKCPLHGTTSRPSASTLSLLRMSYWPSA
ncbi:hypothetical protein CRENBAI_016062 [Crenichthys baileyi]|uniref:Uncharacterized protein n=1 Tax=Crenichthys baileyi TaxID=28760 RepID=A0AAV9RJR2_9TELE